MEHPVKEVTLAAPASLAGQRVVVHGFGTYRGNEPSGFTTWHDGHNRRVPKTTARVYFEVRVHGIQYEGYQDIERAAHDMGDSESPHRVRAGDWRIVYGYGPRRKGTRAEATDKARAVLQEAALTAANAIDRAEPEFFAYHCERYALLSEIEREEAEAAAARGQADENDKRAAELSLTLDALDARQRSELVSDAARAVEEIDADELERAAHPPRA